MMRLVEFRRAATSALTFLAIALAAIISLACPVGAAVIGNDAQLSLTCQFDSGPRAGQIQSFADYPDVDPMPLGIRCTDGRGSTGIAIPDSSDEPGPVQPMPAQLAPAMSFTCQFNTGPRTGQSESYAGVTGMQPMPIGEACTDGQGSSGISISDHMSQSGPVQLPPPPVQPQTSSTCQFNDGPRSGQAQDYAGITGMQPMRVGTRCTDGRGSIGISVPDSSVPTPAEAQLPPDSTAANMSFLCQLGDGPRAGQTRNVADVAGGQPLPVGGPCADGEGSNGVVVSETAAEGSIANAAVGAPVVGLSGAVWADPTNSGTVTGYTYKGRYLPGNPHHDPSQAKAGSVSPIALDSDSGPSDASTN